MPKFGKGGESTSFGHIIDKQNDTVGFEDSSHSYWDLKTGDKYISVTTLIGKYEQPFDEAFWSRYKAAESLLSEEDWKGLRPILLNTKRWKDDFLEIYEINQETFQEKVNEILESYKINREEACAHGTATHLKEELSFYNDANAVVKKFNIGGSLPFKCIPGYYTLDLERGVYPEILLSYDFDGLRIAGQIDCLVIDGNDVILIDHKTNKEIKKTSYYDSKKKKNVMMKFPLNKIQDCNYWHYALQLSLYMYIIESLNANYKCKNLILHHIDRDGKETNIDVPYLRDDVIRMINHYKKKVEVDKELDKLTDVMEMFM